MQVRARMDLDQQQLVNDENANLNARLKGKLNAKSSKNKKRAFGQDLTNKASATGNAQNIEKAKTICVAKQELKKQAIVKKEEKYLSATALAPWDLRSIENDQFVVDYVDDIMSSLREDELLNRNGCVIEAGFDFLEAQKDLNHRMRSVLVDWLVEVHRKFKMLPSTCFLSVNLLDRYLAKKQLSRKKLQLAGCGCLWIASKYHEIYAPEMDDFIYISDNSFCETELMAMEVDILKTLDFTLTVPTILSFAERFTKIATHYLSKEREIKIISDLISFISQSAVMSYDLCRKHPSKVAAACFVYACMSTKVFSLQQFEKDDLAQAIGYDMEQLMPTLKEIDSIVRNGKTTKYKAIFKKFSHSKFSNISKIDFEKLNRKFLKN